MADSLAERPVSEGDLAVAGEISRAMVRFFRSAHRFKTRIAVDRGIDQTGFMLLSVLSDCGPLRSTLLASRVHSDPSTISRQVAHLVGQGLVERTADPVDGRASLLAVTDAGRTDLGTARHARELMLAAAIAHWSDRDRRSLAALLDRLADDLAGEDDGTTTPRTESA